MLCPITKQPPSVALNRQLPAGQAVFGPNGRLDLEGAELTVCYGHEPALNPGEDSRVRCAYKHDFRPLTEALLTVANWTGVLDFARQYSRTGQNLLGRHFLLAPVDFFSACPRPIFFANSDRLAE
jgi:hypothetical protein